MSQKLEKVVIAGASGRVGQAILKALLAAGEFEVTALTRSKSTFASHEGFEIIESDYSESSLVDAFRGQDVVIAALGWMGVAEQSKLVDAAEKAGVKRFIPSEFGGDPTNAKAQETIPMVYKIKTGVIEQLEQKAAANSNFTWTVIAVGVFVDFGLSSGLLGIDTKSHTAKIRNEGKIPISASTLAQTGRVVAAVLSHPAETANKFVYTHSFVVTPNEIIAILEKLTEKTFTISYTTSDEEIEEGRKLLAQGNQAGMINLLAGLIFGGAEYGSNFEGNPGLMNEALGLKGEDLETVIKEVLEGKRP
jgi:uncharacterized protein YbjT (DUF2867 family)